jgi:hypothetical protein
MAPSTIPAQEAQVIPFTPKFADLVDPGAGFAGGIGHESSSQGSFT